jgi:hypothetical protein
MSFQMEGESKQSCSRFLTNLIQDHGNFSTKNANEVKINI